MVCRNIANIFSYDCVGEVALMFVQKHMALRSDSVDLFQ